jgi:DNA invertase Pin-like site-specific DNA recombinase
MRIYGYARVSTKQQNIERQIRNIKDKYPEAIIVTDEFTGTKLDRPGWNKIYKTVKAGDTIVFDQVSRMSRDAEEGFQVYKELFEKGVNLIFLKEPHVNTSVYREAGEKQIDVNLQSGSEPIDRFGNGMIKLVNELLLDLAKEQIRLAFEQAQKEVDDLHQRTREGIETARLNGKQIGQPKGARLTTKKSIKAKELIRKYSKDFEGTLSDVDVMKLIGCARGSYYKYKREMRPYKSAMKAEELREKYIAEHESYIEKEVLRAMEYAESHGMKATKKGIESAIRAEVMAEADRYAEKYLSSMTTEPEHVPSEDTVIKSGVLVDYHYEE